jgi:hypothetical protein
MMCVRVCKDGSGEEVDSQQGGAKGEIGYAIEPCNVVVGTFLRSVLSASFPAIPWGA